MCIYKCMYCMHIYLNIYYIYIYITFLLCCFNVISTLFYFISFVYFYICRFALLHIYSKKQYIISDELVGFKSLYLWPYRYMLVEEVFLSFMKPGKQTNIRCCTPARWPPINGLMMGNTSVLSPKSGVVSLLQTGRGPFCVVQPLWSDIP